MKFKRVWHPYTEWEETKFNMWGNVADKKEWIDKAIEFTSDHSEYGKYMKRVVREWPISCENALTDENLNKKAWIGHAACALAMRCPEYIVRKAWGYLTNEQQLLANREATHAIAEWSIDYSKSQGLCNEMGEQMLFDWGDT